MRELLTRASSDAGSFADGIESLVDGLRRFLPIQNPLHSFVHNNVLQAFEDLPFEAAVGAASLLYQARPYCDEPYYRRALRRGRITRAALDQALKSANQGEDVDEFLSGSISEKNLSLSRANYRRELHDFLIPLFATFLDQGMAYASSPFAKDGLWNYFVAMVDSMPAWSVGWRKELRFRLGKHVAETGRVDDIIRRELEWAGVEASGFQAYCLRILFELKGWAGMFNKLELEPAQSTTHAVSPSLKEFLAVLLVCRHGVEGALNRSDWDYSSGADCGAALRRLAVWQSAFELAFQAEAVSSLESRFMEARKPIADAGLPPVQLLFCIDDREESIRRHAERVISGARTYGVVGYFGVDMRFHGFRKARPTSQCPPVVQPRRDVFEVRRKSHGPMVRDRKSFWQTLTAYYHSRTLVRGLVSTLILGPLSYIPLVATIVFPFVSRRVRDFSFSRVLRRTSTRLILDGTHGYSPEEMAALVGEALSVAGIRSDFSPAVFIISHGSEMTNNPLKQAYGCGACGGNSGKPNARAFAAMANRADVRGILSSRGIAIPSSTHFIPAYHDTCSDQFEVLDREDIPESHRGIVAGIEAGMREACAYNARERTRRFANYPGGASVRAAHRHVQARAVDIAQPRPEYGHSRVSLCIVGRRDLTCGIDLDRRSFLVSYDPVSDPDGSKLASAVAGAVPVAANITLDYYFSRVDPSSFGAGSKLPLNVTALLGVMTGSKSDLRIGLPQQMTEIHEPMRLLVLIEAPEERLRSVLFGQFANPRLRKLIDGRWLSLGRIDPSTGSISFWDGRGFASRREVLPPESGDPSFGDPFKHEDDQVVMS